MKIFDYRYRLYVWLSHYKECTRLLILFLPSIVLVSSWYFLYYKPTQNSINESISRVQKSSKDHATFYELQNNVLELEKELDLLGQETIIESLSFSYEKIFDSLQQAGISIIEFQQDSKRVDSQRPISISMRLAGTADKLLKVFYTLHVQSIFFVVKSFEIIIPQNDIDWTMNVQGELLY